MPRLLLTLAVCLGEITARGQTPNGDIAKAKISPPHRMCE